MLPTQMGIPGGPELLVAIVPVLLLIGGVVLLVRVAESGGDSERLAEAERRIGRLEARIDRLENGDGER